MPEEKFDVYIAPLNSEIPTPLYHQLYTALRDQIQTGALSAGTKIPSEAKLSNSLNVSRITVKRALNELANSGLVRRARGRGTIVSASTDLKFRDPVNNYVENVLRLRKSTKGNVLSREFVSASSETARNLNITEGVEVQKFCHTLSLENKILSYVETFVPHGLAQNFDETELSREPIMTLLMKSGVMIDRTEQVLLGVSADSYVAKILETETGRPLLKIHCIMFENTGRPVEEIHAWYHPDHYQYQMTLTELKHPQL